MAHSIQALPPYIFIPSFTECMFSEKITGSYNILSLENEVFFPQKAVFEPVGISFVWSNGALLLLFCCLLANTSPVFLPLHKVFFLNSAHLAGLPDFPSCCALWSNTLIPLWDGNTPSFPLPAQPAAPPLWVRGGWRQAPEGGGCYAPLPAKV